ncbi:MAG: RHS repeat protein [Prevotella sp.]|jgi:YD repeat-containing protein|nr:RHS repeat protein [Prevotella sp.]
MKKIIIKISLFLFLILRIQVSVSGQGIPEGIDIPSFMIPTNQTWSFIKYGGSPGNLYTGTVGASIPVFEYKDKDFTIPVSLNYASSGYMPNRAVGIAGIGWYLNIGGTITRDIQGFPDDRNIRHADAEEEGYVDYFGYFCRQMSEFNSAGILLLSEWLIPGNNLVTITDWAEVENDPDIFHFSFMGHSGSFVGYGENVTCYNTSAPANEYKVITYTNLNTNKDWWENVQFGVPTNIPGDKLYEQDKLQTIYIITGDGLRYQFKALEKNEYLMFNEYDIPMKMTWYLTKIFAPDGREVIFNYQKGTQIMTFNPRANNVSYSERQPGITTQGGGISITTYYPYYLSSIKIKEDASYSDSDVRNRTVISLSYVDKETVSVVQSINIDKDGNGTDKTYSFNYTTYGQNNDKTPFLTSLGTPLGNYKFSYIDSNSGAFPNNRKGVTWGVDHWGFYNGKANTKDLYIPTSSIDYSYNETITGTSRYPDFSMAKKGMLESISYPTGGKTVFEYEPHTYSKEIARNNVSTNNEKPFYPRLISIAGNNAGTTGGVRLKSIKDYDLNGSTHTLVGQKQYTYTESNGSQSSGILLKSPRYKIQYRITGRRKGHYSSGSITFNGLINLADESNFPSAYDKTHIEYSEVKETNSDGSYTIYKYSNYQTTPDVMPSIYEIDDSYTNSNNAYNMKISTTGSDNGLNYSSDMRDYVNNLLMEPMSMHMYRGKPKEISHYDNTAQLVEKTDYFYWYENSKDPDCQEYDARSGDLIYVKKIPIESRPLVKTVITRSGIAEQTDYEYNGYGRLSKTSKLQSDGSRHISVTRYPDENIGGYYDLTKNNFLSFPVREETRLKRTDNSQEELISRTDYLYTRTGTGSNLNYAVTEIKSKIFDPPRSTEVNAAELETEMKYEYSAEGRLRQTTSRDGMKSTYLWGYANKYVIAIIENASYSQVEGVLGATKINSLSSGIPTDAEINNLWTQLKGASLLSGSMVSVATYKSHAGITSATNPAGCKTYYEYDAQDRLTTVKDEQGNIIENYSYRFRPN